MTPQGQSSLHRLAGSLGRLATTTQVRGFNFLGSPVNTLLAFLGLGLEGVDNRFHPYDKELIHRTLGVSTNAQKGDRSRYAPLNPLAMLTPPDAPFMDSNFKTGPTQLNSRLPQQPQQPQQPQPHQPHQPPQRQPPYNPPNPPYRPDQPVLTDPPAPPAPPQPPQPPQPPYPPPPAHPDSPSPAAQANRPAPAA